MKKNKILSLIAIYLFLPALILCQESNNDNYLIRKYGLPENAYNIFLSIDSVPVQWNIPSGVPGLDQVVIAGRPPKNYRSPIANPTDGSVILNNVPAFDWSFGCSATSAAMLAGFYDNMGCPNIYTGPTNNGIMPMDNSSWGTVEINGETLSQCPLSATRLGVDGRTTFGHVDDYWVNTLSVFPDPYITGGWTQHTYNDCTGDYMKTNQWNYGNIDGATKIYYLEDGTPYSGNYGGNDGCYGLSLFFTSRGYPTIYFYNQYIEELGLEDGFTFYQYKEQIDAGRPVLIHVTGHDMLGVGYNTTGNIVYLHDTWDYNLHQMVWGEDYSGMEHRGVSVIAIASIPYNIVLTQPHTSGTYTASNQINMKPGFSSATIFTAQIWQPVKGATIKFFQNEVKIAETVIETDYTYIYPDLWDGTDTSGEKVEPGEYQYVISKDGIEIGNGFVSVK